MARGPDAFFYGFTGIINHRFLTNQITRTILVIFAAGHQPAADHILERFEIFGSMVGWFNGSMPGDLGVNH